ncbi:MAG: DNA recombination protein RmuC [Muribaculaceae bacterium]|nr:DNA recombination protein RmuC [Muribaculaceae bacterium]
MEIALIASAIVVIALAVVLFISLNNRAQRLVEENRIRYEHQIESLNNRLNEQASQLAQQTKMEFQILADTILSKKEETLSRENNRQLSEILSPLTHNIDDFRKAVDQYYVNDTRDKGMLTQQLEQLMTANRRISEETRRLSNALSSNTRAQGRWGETVLENMLINAGMVRDVNYMIQAGKDANGMIRDDDDNPQKPDVIVILPDNRKIIIDAKVSLTDYMQYVEAENDDVSKQALKKHTDSVKKHVNELAVKQYHKNIAGAMEHTLMFIPNDAAYIAAVTYDKTLWDFAYQHNVVIVSGTHLLSVLQLIKQIWRIENQNRNAEEIARLGGLIFDKLVSFMNDFADIQRHITAANKAYDKCTAHIDNPTVGLKARTLKLRDLGSRTTKRLSE